MRGIVAQGDAAPELSVLVVDDEVAMLRRPLERALRPWKLDVAESALAALGVLARQRQRYTALVADLCLGAVDGIELCRRAVTSGYSGIVVVWSGYLHDDLRARALRAGAHAVLPKGADPRELRDQLDRLVALATGPDRERTTLPPLPTRRQVLLPSRSVSQAPRRDSWKSWNALDQPASRRACSPSESGAAPARVTGSTWCSSAYVPSSPGRAGRSRGPAATLAIASCLKSARRSPESKARA